MKCPACENSLTPTTAGDVQVDICEGGCGGIWFDRKEIESLDEEAEIAGENLLNITRRDDVVRRSPPLSCPVCVKEPLVRQYFDSASKVEVDLCWSCGGLWVDTGELKRVRSQFKTAAERQKAGDAFVAGVLSQHSAALGSLAANEVQEFDKNHSNRFRSMISTLKSLFDPLDDGVFK